MVDKILVIDKEKYFTLSYSEITGNDGYYTDNKQLKADDVIYKKKREFEHKVLVLITISEDGMSKPYIQESRGVTNANVYINKCLRPNLAPFIKEHYNVDNYIFWTDIAIAHYAKVITKYLEFQSITFFQMNYNPPNVPQMRPIETFWANLSLKVYDKGWQAQTKTQLIRCIKNKLK